MPFVSLSCPRCVVAAAGFSPATTASGPGRAAFASHTTRAAQAWTEKGAFNSRNHKARPVAGARAVQEMDTLGPKMGGGNSTTTSSAKSLTTPHVKSWTGYWHCWMPTKTKRSGRNCTHGWGGPKAKVSLLPTSIARSIALGWLSTMPSSGESAKITPRPFGLRPSTRHPCIDQYDHPRTVRG